MAICQNSQSTKITIDHGNGALVQTEKSSKNNLYFSVHEKTGKLPLFTQVFDLGINEGIDSIKLSNLNYSQLPYNEFLKISNLELPDSVVYFHEILKSNGTNHLTLFISPYFIKGGITYQIDDFNFYFKKSPNENNKLKGKIYSDNSVLANGDFYKVKISSSGIYKITGSDLQAMGFSISNLATGRIKIYGNGGGMLPEPNSAFTFDDLQENAIEIHDINNNGLFESSDYLLFYGKGPHAWNYNYLDGKFSHKHNLYDGYAYYFVNIGDNDGLRLGSTTGSTSNPNVFINDFIELKYYENDSLNNKGTGKRWYGEEYDIETSHNFKFSTTNALNTGFTYIKLAALGRSSASSAITVNANGISNTLQFSAIPMTYDTDFGHYTYTEFQVPASNSTNISTSYNKPTSSSEAWLDYIEVMTARKLQVSESQMHFRNSQYLATGNIAEFTVTNGANSKIWEITDWTKPQEIKFNINGADAKFILESDSLREFILFSNSYLTVTNVGKVENQNLHSITQADYVICYNKIFKAYAEELAEYHRDKNFLNVVTVDQEQLFNEFSSGAKDVTALRNFMKMLYDRANGGTTRPKYLLLFGDASYDYKDRIESNTNIVMTFESDNSESPAYSYASDDYFGLLDDTEGNNCYGGLDVGIGRFPVSTTEQARQMLDKLYVYNSVNTSTNNQSCQTGTSKSAFRDWRNTVCFIGDDEDSNTHIDQANDLADYVSKNYPVYNIDKIYLDAYVQETSPGGQSYPEAERDLMARFEKGALLINYTGHGGETKLAHEGLLEISDINNFSNIYNLPLFITATCEFSRYDDPKRVSAGELVWLNPNGGAINMLTTSRLTYSNSNFALNYLIMQKVFEQSNGEYYSVGDLMRMSKVAAGSLTVNRNFILLGDPAQVLAYPRKDIVLTEINSTPIAQFSDTINSLSTISMKGYISHFGQKDVDFNGFVYPTFFDKKQKLITLGNDPGSAPYTFDLQKNVIYKGKATVTNGDFEFTFIVPKDINYSYGYGKISLYATDLASDAKGYYDSVMVGGSSTNIIDDNDGPQISIYFNDKNFTSGGLTDENPVLIAYLSDENGINTTGNGIGHDIVATIDGQTSDNYTLNDYYLADEDTYKSGVVIYSLSNIAVGKHNLAMKAWDILNNSSTENIDFVVVNSNTLSITNLFNYPNPVNEFTNFVFEHNMTCSQMTVELEIFDVNGRIVNTLTKEITEPGFTVNESDIKWEGDTENGDALPNGIYPYRIKITSELGQSVTKSGKIILLK